MEGKSVFHSIQALRAIAAAAVALYHTQIAFQRAAGDPAGLDTYLFRFGAVGVHIFFVISGFVMVTTIAGKPYSPTAFLRRRLLRIYPIYWICAAIYVALYILVDTPIRLAPETWIAALMLTPASAGSIIGPGWTLAFEMYFYLCFALAMAIPLVIPAVTQKMANALLAIAFVVCIATRIFVAPASSWHDLATNPLLVEFLAGTMLGWLVYERRLPTQWGAPLIGAGLLSYAVFIVADYEMTTRVITMGIGSVLIVAGALAWETGRGAGALMRFAGRLGDSSYALYLIHIIVIAMVVRLADAGGWEDVLPAWLIALILLPMLVAIGEGVHRTIERPVLAILNRRQRELPRSDTVEVRPSTDGSAPEQRDATA